MDLSVGDPPFIEDQAADEECHDKEVDHEDAKGGEQAEVSQDWYALK